MKALFTLCLLFYSFKSFAFVENTLKGYANCMACHVAPTGGALLNNYGRALSQELMSTVKVGKSFSDPYYGLVKNKKNVTFGGQLRTIQVWAENDQVKVKRQFLMQNNLEFAAQYANAFLVGTIGTQEGPDSIERKGEFLSERHYVMLNSSPTSRVRIGKFRQHFGINHPNHNRLIKRKLGFGSNSEAYQVDFTQFSEWGEYNFSSSLGDIHSDGEDDSKERNLALNITHYLGGKSRAGISALTGKSGDDKRDIIGVNLVTPLTKKLYLKSEIDYLRVKDTTTISSVETTKSLYGEHQLGYFLYRGINSYLFFEHGQDDLSSNETLQTAPGIGLQLLPIAHVEIQAEYQRTKFNSDPDNINHAGFVVFHLYH